MEEMREGAVTLIDILGWKGIWQRKQNAIDDILKLINVAEHEAKKALTRETLKSEQVNVFKDLRNEFRSISDTIVMFTFGECNIALEFQAALASIIICQSFIQGIPVRGATCYGKFSAKGSIMVGPAIDEVASWYETCDWIGVTQTPSALFRCEPQKFVMGEILIPYKVSIKNYGTFETLCVNWPFMWKAAKHKRSEIIDSFLLMQPITPDISVKLLNTLNFYQYITDQRNNLK